jgi:hypothetical protein
MYLGALLCREELIDNTMTILSPPNNETHKTKAELLAHLVRVAGNSASLFQEADAAFCPSTFNSACAATVDDAGFWPVTRRPSMIA